MTQKIQIPDRLDKILSRDEKLRAAIIESFDTFMPWISSSGMTFFPAFTDHSEVHIQEVLKTSDALIADEALTSLSPEDVAVLAIAILLHDSAMHLTEDVFRALVLDEKPGLFGDEKSWKALWDDFRVEASRFDGRKQKQIFGDLEPADVHELDINNLSESDKLLIGEFVRRFHTRMAHEFATRGVPSLSKQLQLSSQLSDDLRYIAGLVARSHGVDIRHFFPLLEEKNALIEYRKSHPVFLMTILRVADYIQLQATRAPVLLLSVKSLRSPVSIQEWRIHDSIKEIKWIVEDPEAIFVDTLPVDVRSFLRLRDLIKDVQRELDSSWAAIGEVYGRIDKLRNLKLTIRRVKSNLENIGKIESSLSFIPVEARFTTAGTDMLKLLVKPLYSDSVGMGVRELIQNALDACKELQDLKSHHGAVPAVEDTPAVAVQLVEETDGKNYVVVVDNGIGMTVDILINYFLQAGSSFRNSDVWREEHENLDGESRVLRGGRFGIGALAAFLLGPRIEVVTRHHSLDELEGITFSASLEDADLELKKVKAPVGTTIRIQVTDNDIWVRIRPSSHYLEAREPWRDPDLDWYFLNEPRLTVTYFPRNSEYEPITLTPRYSLPNCDAKLSDSWNRLMTKSYRDVQWSFTEQPYLTCNGTPIIEHETYSGEFRYLWESNSRWSAYFSILRPSLSIFDQQARLPINLQRNNIASSALDFDAELLKEISAEYLAFVTCIAPNVEKWNRKAFREFVRMTHGYYGVQCNGGSQQGTGWTSLFAYTNKGYSFLYGKPFSSAKIRRLLLVPNSGGILFPDPAQLNSDMAVMPMFSNVSNSNIGRWFRVACRGESTEMSGPLGCMKVASSQMIIRKKFYEELQKPLKVKKEYWGQVRTHEFGEDHYLLNWGQDESADSQEFRCDFVNASNLAGIDVLILYELQDESWGYEVSSMKGVLANECPIEKGWESAFDAGIMPYKLEDRMKMYSKLNDQNEYFKKRERIETSHSKESVGWKIKTILDATTVVGKA